MLSNKYHSRPLTYYAEPTTTALTTIYTVPTKHTAQLMCLQVTKLSTSGNANFTMDIESVRLNDTMHIYHDIVVSHGTALTVDTLHLYLGPGDVIKVSSSVANALAVTLSLDEHYDPNATHGT